MKFIDVNGILVKGRRFVSSFTSPSAEQLEDKYKLAEIVRDLTGRIAALEARSAPEAVEIEKTVGAAGAITEFHHNFDCPVRWYVVYFSGAGAAGASLIVNTATTTSKVLALRSYSTGKVVLRIEPSQYTVSL